MQKDLFLAAKKRSANLKQYELFHSVIYYATYNININVDVTIDDVFMHYNHELYNVQSCI